jgi:hypothetical protein
MKAKRVIVWGVAVGVVGALSWVAFGNLREVNKNGNETGAISALGEISEAQSLFREGDLERDGNLDYGTLAELGAAGLIDATLASGSRGGYLFEASHSPTTSEFLWYAVARPEELGVTGDRLFGANQQGNVFYTTATQLVVDPRTCEVPVGAGVT